MVLFIVDTSFSGFFGSGDRPTSAVERIFLTSSSGARPVNSTWPSSLSSSRSATSSSKQSPEPMSVKAMSSRPMSWITMSAARTTMSTPSWGPMTPMYAARNLRPRRCPGSCGPRLSFSGSGPVRTTVTSAGALPLRRMAMSR